MERVEELETQLPEEHREESGDADPQNRDSKAG
jgi:hypothetical protein